MRHMKLKKRKILFIICLFTGIFFLGGCQKNKAAECKKTEELLGTIITATIYADTKEEGEEALNMAFKRVCEIEAIMSAKKDTSELSRLNQTAAKAPVKVSEELYCVIEDALKYAEFSDGALDPTIGKLIDLWGIGTEQEKVPSKEEIAPYVNQENYKNVILDQNAHTVFFKNNKIQLDLGAIAKGYAADEMKKLLTGSYHISSGMLSLGGNVLAIGTKPNGELWNVGIVNPLDTTSVRATLQMEDHTLVTSGNYERYFMKDEKRYHHILDPRTGYPAEAGVISSSIMGKVSMDCDALSTAAYILGSDKGMELLRSMNGIEGMFVKEDGTLVKTNGLENHNFSDLLEK